MVPADCTPRMSAALSCPARYGSSPRDSNARPQRGSRTMLIVGPRSTLAPFPASSDADHRPVLLLEAGVPGGGGGHRSRQLGHPGEAVAHALRAVLKVDRGDAQRRDGGDVALVTAAGTVDELELLRLRHGGHDLLDPLADRRGRAHPGTRRRLSLGAPRAGVSHTEPD